MRTLMAIALLTIAGQALAQSPSLPETISIRDGETVALGKVGWTSSARCESFFKSVQQVQMMEGPSEISLKFEPGKVLFTSEKCKRYVNGGTIMATAKGVTDYMDSMLVYRVRFEGKDGPHEITGRYHLLLFPAEAAGNTQ
jgi:hypothetical protein